jgi:hypothetical protein
MTNIYENLSPILKVPFENPKYSPNSWQTPSLSMLSNPLSRDYFRIIYYKVRVLLTLNSKHSMVVVEGDQQAIQVRRSGHHDQYVKDLMRAAPNIK